MGSVEVHIAPNDSIDAQRNMAITSHTVTAESQRDVEMITDSHTVAHEDQIDQNATTHENSEDEADDNTGFPRRPVIRQSFDVHIIYDTEHTGADDPRQLVKLLEEELERLEYKYTDCGRDCLPGRSSMQQQVDMMTQADFIICFLSILQQTEQMCTRLSHCVQKAFLIKRNQGLTNRVIPVMCNMSGDQVRRCVCNVTELMMTDHIPAREGDRSWIQRVMAALAATPAGMMNILLCDILWYRKMNN